MVTHEVPNIVKFDLETSSISFGKLVAEEVTAGASTEFIYNHKNIFSLFVFFLINVNTTLPTTLKSNQFCDSAKRALKLF